MEGFEVQLSRYKSYLGSLVGSYEGKSYEQLFDVLFNKEFYSIIEFDRNRESYGIDLRRSFCNEEMCVALGPVRVLEVLIAFANQIDTILMSTLENPYRADLWFWVMMENLNLTQYDDRNWLYTSNQEVNRVLDIFLDRKYDSHGRGGLFPMTVAPSGVDMRQIELWYQAQLYFLENYL